MARRRPNRKPDPEFTGTRADGECEHASHADNRDEQRDAGKAAEHQRIQPIRGKHFRSDVVQGRRPLHGLIGREVANDPADRRDERVRIRSDVDEKASTADFLIHPITSLNQIQLLALQTRG